MPAKSPVVGEAESGLLRQLGERLRAERKRQRVTAVATAQAAGLSRVTLHRIERGEPSVAVGAWIAVAHALGLTFDLRTPRASGETPARTRKVRLRDYPQLQRLAWQLHGVTELEPREALELYERNWRMVDRAALSDSEAALIDELSREFGGGRLLV